MTVECDNTTAIAYLNRQGGTRSWLLCQEALLLHEWMLQFNITMTAVHRPGVNNELADYLSRNLPDPTEWSLSPQSCARLFEHWHTPQVDPFAAHTNFKYQVWFSRSPHPMAAATDAFRQTWTGLSVYAFPPFNLIQRTLLQIRDQGVEEAIVVVPNWPARMWYQLLLQMAVDKPVLFKMEIDLMSEKLQARGTLFHPNLKQIHLSVWKLNGKHGAVLATPSQSPRLPWQPPEPRHARCTKPAGTNMSSGALPNRSLQFLRL